MGAVAEQVTVWLRKPSGEYDDLGDEIYVYDDVPVDGVMVVPGDFDEPGESDRLEGVKVLYTLHFPVGFDEDLENCKVTVRGRDCRVIGYPKAYPVSGRNFRYWMQVKVGTVDG